MVRAIYINLKADARAEARAYGEDGRGAARADRVAEAPAEYTVSGDPDLEPALRIDETVKRVRPDDFRGHQAKENQIKRALLPLLKGDVAEVERMFLAAAIALILAERREDGLRPSQRSE